MPGSWPVLKRGLVERVDFVSSLGNQRAGSNAPGRGTSLVITDLGVMAPDPSGELVLVGLHPGATVDQARHATGWDLQLAPTIELTPAPTALELSTLRALQSAS